MKEEIKSEEFQEEVVSDNLQEEMQDEEEVRHSYPSETLQNVPEKFLPPRESVCHTCPNAMWLYVEKELRCWCKEMSAFTYTTKDRSIVLLCDGPSQAEEELESQEQ